MVTFFPNRSIFSVAATTIWYGMYSLTFHADKNRSGVEDRSLKKPKSLGIWGNTDKPRFWELLPPIMDWAKDNKLVTFLTTRIQDNLPKSFTTEKNGGVKAIFIYKGKKFALISSLNNKCYYASIILVDEAKEIFNTKCLPNKKIDYNGLGSSHIHNNDKIYLTIGAPEQASSKIRELAQNTNSFFGKIVEINLSDLDKIITAEEENLDIKIFTLGHRNPQGITKINESFFSVEHGPQGGDELNKIIKNKNYGWPLVSYGTQYHYDQKGKYYEVNHEENLFENLFLPWFLQ